MHPILLRWGPLTLHTYGLFAALGFLAGHELVSRWARRRGLSESIAGEALLPILTGGLLGARVFYVLFHSAEFARRWLEVFKFWQGGLMWQGGFLGGSVAFVLFVRRKKYPLGSMADLFAPAIALGQAVGRLGCFFAGCCYGKTCSWPWAVTFRHAESLAPREQPLHPTQLYDALFNFLMAAFLLALGEAGKPRPPGALAGLYLVLAGLARLLVEPFRADNRGTGWGAFSATGLMALALVVGGMAVLVWVHRRTDK